MDPSVIPALAAVISAIVGGAAGEAGKNAWLSLTALVRRRFGDNADITAALEHPDAHAPEHTMRTLLDHAQEDPEFQQELTKWTAASAHLIQYKHDVGNTVSGDAHISGSVIQAGDVFGSINLGRS